MRQQACGVSAHDLRGSSRRAIVALQVRHDEKRALNVFGMLLMEHPPPILNRGSLADTQTRDTQQQAPDGRRAGQSVLDGRATGTKRPEPIFRLGRKCGVLGEFGTVWVVARSRRKRRCVSSLAACRTCVPGQQSGEHSAVRPMPRRSSWLAEWLLCRCAQSPNLP